MSEENKIEVDIQREIIKTMQEEKRAWEDETVFLTDKIAFNMRNLIRTARKNYYGIFDKLKDPVTGLKKTWIPLTFWLTETVVKNIDMDSKNFNFKSKKSESIGLTNIVRSVVRNWLDKNFFGEELDMMGRSMAIDGTEVWKTWEEDKKMRQESVDLLNFYIDPHAKSIQDTDAVIERGLMNRSEFKSMDGWFNKEEASFSANLHPTDQDQFALNKEGTSQAEVWERWGLMPKSWLTGKKKDKEELIEGHIVVSNLERENPVVHNVEENKKKDVNGDIIKPYEEGWLKRMPGRWYGQGVPEMVLSLQSWINTVVNIRIIRARVSQLGLFKIKKSSPITPTMIRRLAANGAVIVNNMDDIEQMVVDEASEASYKDEETAMSWAQRVTSAHEIATGEDLPASKPATTSALESRAAQSAFVLIKKGMGMFMQRWLQRHAMPVLMKSLKKGDILRLTGSYEEMRSLDEKIVKKTVYDKLYEMTEGGKMVDPFQVKKEVIKATEKLRKMGEDRYVNILSSIDFNEFDVQFYMTNEAFDKEVQVQDLLALGNLAPEYKDIVIRKIADIMGWDIAQFEEEKSRLTENRVIPEAPEAGRTPVAPQQQQAQQQQAQQPSSKPSPERALRQLENANTLK